MVDIKKEYAGFLTVDEAMNMNKEEIVATQKKYQNHVRVELAQQLGAAQNIVKADGVELVDDEGNVHYDFIGNVGTMAVGNANPEIWAAIEKVKGLPALNVLSLRNMSAALAKNLAILSPGNLSKVWFGTGGSEANEAAIKLCKMAFHGARHKMVATENAYHGKTAGSLALTGRDKWAKYQSPVMPAVKHVPFGDADALEEALHYEDVAAFFIEPIQGEGGIKVASIEYLKKVREICDKYGTLFVADEVQCGMGRTGKLWAVEHAGVVPDVITFAKAISGGYVPLGGYITTEEVWNKAYGIPETAFHHTVTFGNNSLGCAAGIAALEYILKNDLITAAGEKGEYMIGKLKEIQGKYPEIIKEVRGKGLMIGVEFQAGNDAEQKEMFAAGVAATMMNKYRVQTMFSINNPVVIRALPPFSVTYKQMDKFIEAFENSVKDIMETTTK